MLPRERTLYRKKNGTVADKQVIASYVDQAFIVQSLDDNFNVLQGRSALWFRCRRRNINAAWVLNKADLDFDRQEIEEQIKAYIPPDTGVFYKYSSARNDSSVAGIYPGRRNGGCLSVLRGVGKSSLVNALCGKSLLLASDIACLQGKDGTLRTRREMVLMDGSGVLIDTPGVRGFGLAMDWC